MSPEKLLVMPLSFFSSFFACLTQDLGEVMLKENRPPDIADGTLEIDLEAYCEERKLIEEKEKGVSVFR